MQLLKSLVIALLLLPSYLYATAQTDSTMIKLEQRKKKWLDNNMYSQQDAVDFIKLTYNLFTAKISKKEAESGIYKINVKFKDCELIVETDSKVQESSYKADHAYEKDLAIIELDKVVLDGNNIKPKNQADPKGMYSGRNYTYAKKMMIYSILSPVGTPQDDRFISLHYEEHLQWAYEFLIGECERH